MNALTETRNTALHNLIQVRNALPVGTLPDAALRRAIWKLRQARVRAGGKAFEEFSHAS